jgi:ribonuclease HIII
MNKNIEEYLSHLNPELAKRGIGTSSQRDIPYGIQLRLGREGEFATLSVYYSEKKGLSKVVGGVPGSKLKEELEEFCAEKKAQLGDFHTWESWIGSDECGKGDYFGALVVAAFAVDPEILPELRKLGVADSKTLRDTQIRQVARKLYEMFNEHIACIVIKPLKYNEIIADMQTRKENLNDLLAWQHSTAIMELLERFPRTQGVMVDQFSRQRKVAKYLKSKDIPQHVEERPRGEQDIAVAAASIIARYQFLQSREAMDRHYGTTFPLGSGNNVLKPAKEFAAKYGWNRLAEVAKLHFVTSRKVNQNDVFD